MRSSALDQLVGRGRNLSQSGSVKRCLLSRDRVGDAVSCVYSFSMQNGGGPRPVSTRPLRSSIPPRPYVRILPRFQMPKAREWEIRAIRGALLRMIYQPWRLKPVGIRMLISWQLGRASKERLGVVARPRYLREVTADLKSLRLRWVVLTDVYNRRVSSTSR